MTILAVGLWAMVALQALAFPVSILSIGKPREPLSAGAALTASIINIASIALLLLALWNLR